VLVLSPAPRVHDQGLVGREVAPRVPDVPDPLRGEQVEGAPMSRRKRREPDENDERVVDRWDAEDAELIDGFDRYCPKCSCWYSAAQENAHAGH
jgi:hypothetical protein